MYDAARLTQGLAGALWLGLLLSCACTSLETHGTGQPGSFDSSTPRVDGATSTPYLDGGLSRVEGELDSTRYEAEDHTAQSGCEQRSDRSGHTGSGFMVYGGKGTWIEWDDVVGDEAGEYDLSFRYANDSSTDRRGALLINGNNVASIPFAPTGSWPAWNTTAVRVSLRRGDNVVRVQADTVSGGPVLDHVVVTQVDPCDTAPGECGCGAPEADCSGNDGSVAIEDQCPSDPNKTQPGVCGCNALDTDSDWDGTPDCHDACPHDPDKDTPGVCGCNVLDTDSDWDATPDCRDACVHDPGKSDPGVCGCNTPDTDSDRDGTPDCRDVCPHDPNKIDPAVCGCNTADTDSDRDGTPDCRDVCADNPNKTHPGMCGCSAADTDSDRDGTPDCHDACPHAPGKIAAGACGCNTPDTDTDRDGTPDCEDECPDDDHKTAPGACGCGVPEGDCGPNTRTVTVSARADAYVDNTHPDQNFGADTQLLVDNDPAVYEAFVRFEVPRLSGEVHKATLRLYVTDATDDGLWVYRTHAKWLETVVTYNNRPSASGGVIAAASADEGWLELDVTAAVTSSGPISFVLLADDSDGVDFDSRETANAPRLVIVTAEGE